MTMPFVNRVLQGDALELLRQLPSDSIDAGMTSPPYNKKEKNKGWLVANVVYDGFADVVPEDAYQRNQVAVLDELHRVIKPGGSFFYNHKIRWERGVMIHPMQWLAQTRWTVRQEIIWDRGIAANIRGWRFWQVEERVYWLCKPDAASGAAGGIGQRELESRHAKLTSIWRIRPERRNPHPAPFPISLPARALASVMGEGGGDSAGVAIDPYAGSGTTLQAARMLGHNYVGLEISPSYCEEARRRIAAPDGETLAQFAAEIDNHKIATTFRQRKQERRHVGRYRPPQDNTPMLMEKPRRRRD